MQKIKVFFFILTVGLSANAFAQLTQIDVVGIQPGVSQPDDVSALSDGILSISGHKLYCPDHLILYRSGKLSLAMCTFGGFYQDFKEMGVVQDGFFPNSVTYPFLVSGYTEKFGPPAEQQQIPLTNRFGAMTYQNRVVWRDENGNRMTILSMGPEVENILISRLTPEWVSQEKTRILKGEGRFNSEKGWLIVESQSQIENDERNLVPDASEF